MVILDADSVGFLDLVISLIGDDDFNPGAFKQAVQDRVGLLVGDQAVNFFRAADMKQGVAMQL